MVVMTVKVKSIELAKFHCGSGCVQRAILCSIVSLRLLYGSCSIP